MFNFNKTVHVVKYRIIWMILSACLLLPGIAAMIYSMITYPTHAPVKVGIDYTGGTILQYGVPETVSNEDVAKTRTDFVRNTPDIVRGDSPLETGCKHRNAFAFVKTESDVHVLDCLTCRTLDHVVDAGAEDQRVRALVHVDGHRPYSEAFWKVQPV